MGIILYFLHVQWSIAIELMKLITSPFFMYVQILASNASAVPCLNHCFSELLLGILMFLSGFSRLPPISTITFSLHHSCTPFFCSPPSSSTSLWIFFLGFCACLYGLFIYLPTGTSSTTQASSFSPLPRFIVRQLRTLPHTGDRNGLLLLLAIAATLEGFYSTTC